MNLDMPIVPLSDPSGGPVFLFVHEWWRDGSIMRFHLGLTFGVMPETPEDEVIGTLLLCQPVTASNALLWDQMFADAAREVRHQHGGCAAFPDTADTICPNVYGVWFEPEPIMGAITDPKWLTAMAPPGDQEVRVARLVTLADDE